MDDILPKTKSRVASTKYTCLACHIAFNTADDQRLHYRSDWHRYNLKRKVADLPAVTLDNFSERVDAQKERQFKDEIAVKTAYHAQCQACDKSYSSENGYQNHLLSKKHREQELKLNTAKETAEVKEVATDGVDETASEVAAEGSANEDQSAAQDKDRKSLQVKAKQFQRRLHEASTEDEIEAILREKMESAPKLSPDSDCLFCEHKSSSLEDNITHMSAAHSFFLPELESLTDVHGLVEYLGEKVSVHNVCLYCNGKGKAFQTLESVRSHMVTKGHTKMLFEDDAEEEYDDFYDYTSGWENVGEGDVMDESEDLVVVQHEEPVIDASGFEMILPSGQKIGHRSLNRYYKQHFKPQMEKESVLIGRLAAQYRMLGWNGEHDTVTSKVKLAQRLRRKEQTAKSLRIGTGANKLQKHFRVQILV